MPALLGYVARANGAATLASCCSFNLPLPPDTMENFRTLLVWQRSHDLAAAIAIATRDLPAYERDELGAQMRRAARSVHANIAEAAGRKVAGRSNADPLRHLAIASGSLHELDSDVEYARKAGYWSSDVANRFLGEIVEIRRMLGGFIRHRRTTVMKSQSEGGEHQTPSLTAQRPSTGNGQPVNLSTDTCAPVTA